MNSSIRSLAAAALLSTLALLAGCGGGGAKDPYSSTPTPPLVVNPSTLNVYPGVPEVLTISSGVGPFQVFSSDATVLPVTQVVSGAAITLVANAIDGADRAVSITVRDAAGQSAVVAATVKPAPTLGGFNITSMSNTQCPGFTGNTGQGSDNADIGSRASICTGETAAAQVLVRTANTSPVPNRQVRFDVLQGAFNFVLDSNGTTFAKTITTLTDQNGRAIAKLKADPSVGTQIALIRATDVTSGNRIDTWFTIVQATAGVASFGVSPQESGLTGYYKGDCGAGSISYLIYGGTPPYRVFINSLADIFLEVGDTRGQSVIVPNSGGHFNAVALGRVCSGSRDTVITITDATGRILNAKFTTKEGTVEPPKPPDPNDLVVTPPDARIACVAGAVVVFTISGGTSPLTVATDHPYVPPAPPAPPPLIPNNGTTVLNDSAIRLNQPYPSGEVIHLAIADAKSKTISATITCQ